MENIYRTGRIGQVVVLDKVTFGENDPLSKYEQPQVFTIVHKDEATKLYTIEDNNGKKVKAEGHYLCGADKWAKSQRKQEKEQKNKEEIKQRDLKSKLDLLKSILIEQGYRIVTKKQAEEIGLA